MTTASLKFRYFIKLASSGASSIVGVFIIWFLPKMMGAADYGRMEYAFANFQVILTAASLCIPLAFFNWVSKKQDKKDLAASISGMSLVFVGITLGLALIVALANYVGFHQYLWPDIPIPMIWGAFFFASSTFLFTIISYLSDGLALTIWLESLKILYSILTICTLFALYYFDSKSNLAIILARSIWIALAGLLMLISLRRKNYLQFTANFDELKDFFSFSWRYVKPLIMYAIIAGISDYFDRWFLQIVHGSKDQAVFSLAFRLSAIAILFTSSMTPLLTREFSVASEAENVDRLRSLFLRIIPFFLLSAVLSIFFSLNSDIVVDILQYRNFPQIIPTLAIMSVYPIHQTLGQLIGAYYYAHGQTKIYSLIGIAILLSGIVGMYLLTAPSAFLVPGMGLGSLGIAIKYFSFNIISTNLLLFFAVRQLSMKYRFWFFLQIKVFFILYVFAYLAKIITREVTFVSSLFELSLSLMVYISLVSILLFMKPEILGIERKFLDSIMALAREKVSGRLSGIHRE